MVRGPDRSVASTERWVGRRAFVGDVADARTSGQLHIDGSPAAAQTSGLVAEALGDGDQPVARLDRHLGIDRDGWQSGLIVHD